MPGTLLALPEGAVKSVTQMSITVFLHLNYPRYVVWSFVSLGSVWAKIFSPDRSNHEFGTIAI